MTRLTNADRESIALKAVASAFDLKLDALKAAEDALAREAYAFIIPADEVGLISNVPANWFRLDTCLRFNVGGYTIRLSMTGEGLPVPFKAKNEEYGGYHCGNLGTIPPGDLCDRIQSHAQAFEDYKAARRKAYHGVTALISGVTTLKRLAEIWPEGEPFFKDCGPASPANLPAVRTDEVNAMLGLAA